MKNWVPAFQLLGIGFYVAVCITGGILVGRWLGSDEPGFIILGLFIGLMLAFYGAYKMVKPLMNNYKNDNKKGNG